MVMVMCGYPDLIDTDMNATNLSLDVLAACLHIRYRAFLSSHDPLWVCLAGPHFRIDKGRRVLELKATGSAGLTG